MYRIRAFTHEDRPAVEALGVEIIDAWDRWVALHLVAGDPVVGHLQAVDRATTPRRRPGSIEVRLTVAPEHRRQGIGGMLYERLLEKVRAIRFAKERGIQTLETENRADHIGMLAINRKLGYQLSPPEVECIRCLGKLRNE